MMCDVNVVSNKLNGNWILYDILSICEFPPRTTSCNIMIVNWTRSYIKVMAFLGSAKWEKNLIRISNPFDGAMVKACLVFLVIEVTHKWITITLTINEQKKQKAQRDNEHHHLQRQYKIKKANGERSEETSERRFLGILHSLHICWIYFHLFSDSRLLFDCLNFVCPLKIFLSLSLSCAPTDTREERKRKTNWNRTTFFCCYTKPVFLRNSILLYALTEAQFHFCVVMQRLRAK